MTKKSISYSELSKKELNFLKDLYVKDKVESMSNEELKKFVIENIDHQIKDTIGSEEELEAWKEMELFYQDKFSEIVSQIQKRFESYHEIKDESENNQVCTKLTKDKDNNEKIDMWED